MSDLQLPAKHGGGPRFVAPEPAQPVRVYRMPEPPTEADFSPLALPSPAKAEVVLHTTYRDRADGFIRATVPLSTVTGAIALVGAVALFSVPFLSFLALLWFFAGFAAVWLAAYLGHLFVSPDGTTWLHSLMLWRVVQREQRFRHDRFWTEYYDQRDKRQ